MEALRTTVRTNLSLSLVLMGLVAEVLFVVLVVGYGLYRAVGLLH